MPWHLNEALTDLSVLPDALGRLVETPLPGGAADPDGTSRLKGFLEASEVNTDLIEAGDIPSEDEGDEYAWLARDLLVLAEKTSLIKLGGPPFQLTRLGRGVQDRTISLWAGGWIAGLLQWRFQAKGREMQPVCEVLEVLAALREAADLALCPGLLLPEFARVMRLLEEGASVNTCMDQIRGWREPSAAVTPVARARLDICDQLGEALSSEDVYRARTTLINILSSGLVVYRGLSPIEPVQYAALNDEYLAGLIQGGTAMQAVANLAKMPPHEVADFLSEKMPG